ncbi:kinesin-like protein KIN-14Q isoform X2 [Magnolia sinica]|uniref:kinesin-like protein KIN-14Q isoform X2 n=1 Tax=Magnolia sinica TaxID=86752 RepID=UPI00265B3D0C|nr:kinesin-like protein KIN-14Q isoform X2 [Magnolia sinica]
MDLNSFFNQMGEDLWQDPLLFTDVSWQEQNFLGRTTEKIHCVYRQEQSSTTTEMEKTDKLLHTIGAQSELGFSLTSPDLVICAGSPDISGNNFEETPDLIRKACRRNLITSVELSLENGINGLRNKQTSAATIEALFPELQTSNENESLEASLELPVLSIVPIEKERDGFQEISMPVLSINVGGMGKTLVSGGIDFQSDDFFMGGDVIRTEAKIGGGEGLALYQTARFGNFSYKFQSLSAGKYIVDLHLAEIIFTEGPPGMRVFDVFIQEEKVVSGIDIYAQVGSNQPLVLSDLKALVDNSKDLSIRFEGVLGTPLVCGISIRKDPSTGEQCQTQIAENNIVSIIQGQDHRISQIGDGVPMKEECGHCNGNAEREAQKLKRAYDSLHKEQTETKRALEEFKRENELKSKECHEAWMSLQELQNELMRKSMHVGSLAYAVEGQVKEKSRWFSSLRELSEKFKILKIQHLKLSDEALECKKCLSDMTHMTAAIQSIVNQRVDLEREHEDLKLKFVEGAKERKELYNKVLELKGNIRVFCRCRPLNAEEIALGASMSIDFESAKDGELTVKANGAPKKVFKFDSVFSPQVDQADVFEDTAPFATSVLDGFNVCIFAYGQTGTGKTFTMEGTEVARGVNYRTLEELFRIIRERQGLFRYEISVSVLEVYNEQIRDLLASASQPGVAARRLEIRQVAEGVHHVPGLVEAHVNNTNEVWDVLQTGSNARAVGSTNANEHSSRSHCIHCVMVRGENLMNGECMRSKLWLVDLAGSERIAKTEVQGERLKETQNINRSLSALGDVISALATKSPHIPFRNSKLTHLLQDSLGGDSKTLMFVQISPNENDVSETLCSLNFASRVRGVELGPAKKNFDISELSRQKQLVEKAKQDIKSKDMHIKRMEESIYGLELKMKARDMSNKNLQDKVKELESQLLIERKLARQHVDTKIAEQQQQQQQQQQEEQHVSSMKPPLVARQLGNHKHATEPATALAKDLVNVIRPLTENNSNKLHLSPPPDNNSVLRCNKSHMSPPPDNNSVLKCNKTQKENKPEMPEQPSVPARTGRASICTTARRVPIIPAPRRNSLIPFPAAVALQPLPDPTTISPPLPPLPLLADPIKEETENNCPEPTPWSCSKGPRSSKKISNILRRSVQKKVYISPLHHHIRRGGGPHGGTEKVRISIGSRGRLAQRVLVSNANKVKEGQQKLQPKDKERGWNNATTVKGVF